MALTQEERIAISKKIIEIPLQNASADKIKAQIEAAKAEAYKEDNGNKNLINNFTPLINSYQSEIERYDGNGRTQLVEQDFIDSVNKKLRNPFFPNDNSISLPSISDGVWKNFSCFSGNKAIGRDYNETYSVVTKEQGLIDDINAKILIVEAFSNIKRSSGQKCAATGTCSLPQYTTQSTCVGGGGVWTPGPDSIVTDNDMQTAGTNLKNAIQAWESFLNSTDALVPTTDTNPTRSAQNIASKQDIADSIVIIDTWQGLNDYDTSHGQTTCVGFNSYDVSLLGPTKFRAVELQAIKDEITARQSFVGARIGQITTNLGFIVQDMSSGDVSSSSGFYGQRFRFIDMRLNLMAGSLSKAISLEQGQGAQDQLKKSNENAGLAYSSIVVATAFRAPALGTKTIHVMDITGFNVSDNVYVVAEEQQEIATTISNIQGNTVFLTNLIPQKYRQDNGARLYKVL